MQRPLLMQLLPSRARQTLLWRFYRSRRNQWPGLYSQARLRFAPRMALRNLLPGDILSDSIAFTGSYEDSLSRHLSATARRSGGLLVDVGANIGYMSILWAAQHPQARVLAIEASPRIFPLLKANVDANGLQGRISPLNVAAGRQPGSLPFDVGPDEQTGWGGFVHVPSARSVEVDVIRLDDLLASEVDISVLKIDVEGADAWVLMGAEQLLRRKVVREIWFEENRERARALGIPDGAAAHFVEQCGYRATPMAGAKDSIREWRAIPA
jgi:FkbM family methyltransferase